MILAAQAMDGGATKPTRISVSWVVSVGGGVSPLSREAGQQQEDETSRKRVSVPHRGMSLGVSISNSCQVGLWSFPAEIGWACQDGVLAQAGSRSIWPVGRLFVALVSSVSCLRQSHVSSHWASLRLGRNSVVWEWTCDRTTSPMLLCNGRGDWFSWEIHVVF